MSHWELWRYRLAQLGAAGNIGLALTVASLLWLMAITLPLYFKASQLTTTSTTQKASAPAAGDAAPPTSGEAAHRAEPAKSMDTALARIFSAAKANGVRIDRGEYSVAANAANASQRFAINMPVQGNYAAIRGFLSTVLNDNPGLALEQMRLSRQSPEDSELSASLKFALTLGGAR